MNNWQYHWQSVSNYRLNIPGFVLCHCNQTNFHTFSPKCNRTTQEAEEAAAARQAKIEAHAAHAAAAAQAAAEPEHIAKSPSDFSCHSYELFVGQEKGNDDNNKEKMSIRSEGLESVSEITRQAPTALASAKARKVSTVSMSECFACFFSSVNSVYGFVDKLTNGLNLKDAFLSSPTYFTFFGSA